VRVDSLGSGRLQLAGLVLDQVSGVVGQRALVAGKVARQCLKRRAVASCARPVSTKASARKARTASSRWSDPASSSVVSSATLSSGWPRFRNELASWITARRRRSPVNPCRSAWRYGSLVDRRPSVGEPLFPVCLVHRHSLPHPTQTVISLPAGGRSATDPAAPVPLARRRLGLRRDA
jgi:hypothetical protein